MAVEEITKQRYDEIKNKELEQSGLDVYEAYDDPDDADEIITNMEIETQVDVEAEDIDLIQPDYVFETPSQEKYIDKTDTSKPGNTPTGGKVVTCSEINESNFKYNLLISDYFTIGDLSIRTSAGKHVIRDTKTIDSVTYTKFDLACNLKALAVNVLDKIKKEYPDMQINSAYRNNGGSSQHEKGQAADMSFTKHSQREYINIAQWIQSNINYDQLLFEFRNPNSVWIHVSYNPKGNRAVSSPYPKYATFLNDKTYKRLSLENVPNFTYRA